MEQKRQQKVFVFQIIACEMRVESSHNPEQDTFHRMSMCSKTPLRFQQTLRETFSKSTSLGRMKNMKKALSWRFRKYLGHFHMFTVKACSETALFGELSNQDFHSL